jgi:hypothetical protein
MFGGSETIVRCHVDAPWRFRRILLVGIRVLTATSLLYAAFFFKFVGAAYSVALFTKMSEAVHGLISQPVFRIGAGIVETVLAILFPIPKTARLAAELIVATSPKSVYSQRSSATAQGWPEGTAWAARPTARLGNQLHELHMQNGRHDVRPPGSPSTQLAAGAWRLQHGNNASLSVIPARGRREW